MFKSVLAVAVAVGAVGLLAQEAAAGEVKIKQKCDSQCLRSACDATGGSFGSGDAGSYCFNNSKGTSVNCNNDGTNCTGWVPRGGSLGGSVSSILKGGAAPAGGPPGYGVKGTPPSPQPQRGTKGLGTLKPPNAGLKPPSSGPAGPKGQRVPTAGFKPSMGFKAPIGSNRPPTFQHSGSGKRR